jgi:hypothetical protein
MATDYTQKITSIEEQIAQLENRRRELLQKNKERERKARTKRLIERGAIVESIIGGMDELTGEQFQRLIESVMNTDQARRILAESKRHDSGRPAPKPTAAKPSDGDEGEKKGDNGAAGTD